MLMTVLIVLIILALLGGGIGFRSNRSYGYGGIGKLLLAAATPLALSRRPRR